MKHVAAIDVGCTKIYGALVSEKGKVLKEVKIPSDFFKGGLNIMARVFRVIDSFKSIRKIDAVGIGIGGRVDTEKGVINWGAKQVPQYSGLKVRKMTEDRYGIPCAVENDVKAAGYGERWLGAGKNAESFVCVTLGTGTGSAVWMEGKMLHGSHWSGGEMGHMILYPNGRQCTCGLKGCVEQYLSGTALVNIYNEKAANKISTGYGFFNLVKAEDAVAAEVLDGFTDDLYTLLLTVFNSFDPEKVIIGGGLIDTREYWWDKLQIKLSESPINQVFHPAVVPALLGSRAGYYGAAYLALEKLQ